MSEHTAKAAVNPIYIESPFLQRSFALNENGFVTENYKSKPKAINLIKYNTCFEAKITVNGIQYRMGGSKEPSFIYKSNFKETLKNGGEKLEVIFEMPVKNLEGLTASIIYEAPNHASVLIKYICINNKSQTAIRLDGIVVEDIIPRADEDAAIIFENDYVRGAMSINESQCRSPWIEHQEKYVTEMLKTKEERTSFSYPVELDRWILPGECFQSFRVFEFVVSNKDEELRGMDFRRATRALFPWTTVRWLSCYLAPAVNVEEYYKGIEFAAEVGYEGVQLHHGWVNGELTSPIFSSYGDYEPRSDLFPNGWEDVRKLTDFAHSKGVKISFYTIYVTIWDDIKSKVVVSNNWQLVWDKDDDSERWGTTLCPGTDWGPFVNNKIEEAMFKGGFDAWHLDGPYYGDVSVAEPRPYRPGGANQLRAWERQKEFYHRMRAHGFHGEAAQGFCAFANGMSRITTTGYEEAEFGSLGMWGQILSTRKGAYGFTKIYRPQQATTFIPVVSWLDGPCLEPMEEHAQEYDAYLANCFGYGFQGKCFQHVPYDGPKSKAAITRWINFWKSYSKFFEEGFLIHVAEPDGVNLDAVMHVVEEFGVPKALLVVYNPLETELYREFVLPFNIIGFPYCDWVAISENGEAFEIKNDRLNVSAPPQNATWYEILLK